MTLAQGIESLNLAYFDVVRLVGELGFVKNVFLGRLMDISTRYVTRYVVPGLRRLTVTRCFRVRIF
jgi:hypothetical protein